MEAQEGLTLTSDDPHLLKGFSVFRIFSLYIFINIYKKVHIGSFSHFHRHQFEFQV